MNCEEIKELLSAFLDGELGEQEAAQVREHLDRCPDCAAELAALRQVSALYRELPDPEPPAEFEHRVWAELRNAPQAPAAARKRFRRPLLTGTRLSVAAGLAVFLCVVILAVKTQSQRRGARVITDAKAISESVERYAVDRSRAAELPRAKAGQSRDELAQTALKSAASLPETPQVIIGEPAPAAAPQAVAPQAASAPAPEEGASRASANLPVRPAAPPAGRTSATGPASLAIALDKAGAAEAAKAEPPESAARKDMGSLAPLAGREEPMGQAQPLAAAPAQTLAQTPKSETREQIAARAKEMAPPPKSADAMTGRAIAARKPNAPAAVLFSQGASAGGPAASGLFDRPITLEEGINLAGGAAHVAIESAELKRTGSGAVSLNLTCVARLNRTSAILNPTSATARVILHLDKGVGGVEDLEAGRIRFLIPSAMAAGGEASNAAVIPLDGARLKEAHSVSLSLAPVEKAGK